MTAPLRAESMLSQSNLESPVGDTAKPSHRPIHRKIEDEGKSAKEIQLERLLFGDAAGFLDNVEESNREIALIADSQYAYTQDADGHSEEDGEFGITDHAGLDDGQLFFIDSAADSRKPSAPLSAAEFGGSSRKGRNDEVAWEDSDDERLQVSLASHSRLRKLRLTEAEDVIDGREYTKRLREQFERLHPTPGWASPASHRKKRRRTSENLEEMNSEVSVSDEEEDEMDEDLSAEPLARLLQSSESLTRDASTGSGLDASRPLRLGTIDMRRLRDVGDPQASAIETLSFHPTISPSLILSSGPSGVLSMHHISTNLKTASSAQPAHNPLLTSLLVRGLAVSTCLFHSSGTRIFFGGRRRYFHIWDLPSGAVSRVSRFAGNRETQQSCEHFALSPCGRYMALRGTSRKGGGCVNIIDATTGQWSSQVRVEGRGGVIDMAWWEDGDGLVVLGKSGDVVEYSMEEKRVVARWKDEGAAGSTVISLGGRLTRYSSGPNSLGPNRWVAVGSQSGIVNIYDRSQWSREKLPENPSPRKVLQQLTTPTSMLAFTADGQVMAMASRWKKDALRLVHLPSCTVYKNWPTGNTPLGRVSSIAWAPNSRMLAVGNEAGKIRLFEAMG